jgi:hypothetical protein
MTEILCLISSEDVFSHAFSCIKRSEMNKMWLYIKRYCSKLDERVILYNQPDTYIVFPTKGFSIMQSVTSQVTVSTGICVLMYFSMALCTEIFGGMSASEYPSCFKIFDAFINICPPHLTVMQLKGHLSDRQSYI